MTNPFVGFAPWIIFWVVAAPSTWEYATLGALIAAVILAVPDAQRHSLKLLDVTTIAFFAVFSVLALFLDRSDLSWLEDYSQAISSGVLAVIVLGSLAFVPFTEQYARESTPREVWDRPEFRQVNRTLTTVWGLVFAVSAVCGVIAQNVDTGKAWLNWIIPIVLIVGAFKYTANVKEQRQTEVAAGPVAAY
jgi:hypothetical protein